MALSPASLWVHAPLFENKVSMDVVYTVVVFWALVGLGSYGSRIPFWPIFYFQLDDKNSTMLLLSNGAGEVVLDIHSLQLC